MLIPHLHFCGDCTDAIGLYEKAFGTTVETVDYAPDGKAIAHAAMDIHGRRVFLNDNFGNKENSFDCGAVHLILTFRTADELLACYDVLKADGDAASFTETPYSALVGNFLDRFGVLWGFMVTAD